MSSRCFASCMQALLVLVFVLSASEARSDEAAPSVEQLASQLKPSLAVFHVDDRDGRHDRGIGTGFVISADGLIATNLHVIGEGRAFEVELSDGRKPRVTEVFASDRHLDLAIVRVDTADGPLTPLTLAQHPLATGSPIVVMGNPFGLSHSVVSGVLSGRRMIDEREMLQLAIPIEPGNSGGPVVDMQGNVHGIVTMKSIVSDNLGFALDVAALKSLWDQPNTIRFERWVTIGRLNSRQWETRFGANWRQRAGTITVEGPGEGFGGRALCLAKKPPPDVPFELAVRVKLGDEGGAAGLAFHSDGGDRHYGFYPSNGRLRVTCFRGPTVFSWEVMAEIPSEHYRAGDWNRLRVRVEDKRFLCYVNDHLVFVSSDRSFTGGRVGLVKFRDTKAEFRQFECGATVTRMMPEEQTLADLMQRIDALPPLSQQTTDTTQTLAEQGTAGIRLLRERAEALNKQAESLRKTAEDVHLQIVVRELGELIHANADFDLLRAALLVARIDDQDLDVDAYLSEADRMAEEIRAELPEESTPEQRLQALNRYLFEENGFHGSRHEYYHRANSHMHRVMDDREGLPITLSVLYMELGRRLGITIEGVGLPGHFVVRYVPPAAEGTPPPKPQLIDVFDQAKPLTLEDARAIVRENLGEPGDDEYLKGVTRQEIVQRILRNLLGVAEREEDAEAMRRYLEALVAITPDAPQFRGMRALARYHTGRRAAAIADLDWFLEHQPEGVDLERIREMREAFARETR